MLKTLVYLVLILASLASCQDDSFIIWKDCPRMSGAPGGQCSTMEVPIDWDEPNGEKIELLLRRYKPLIPSNKQIWLIDGGPGGSGESLADPSLLQPLLSAGWKVYIPSQRGTGQSTALSCAEQQKDSSPEGSEIADEEIALCLADLQTQWGIRLALFNGDQASQDLGALIQRHEGVDEVALMGISYGTHLIQRYLQYYPNQVDSIVMDGVLSLKADVWMQDAYANDVGLSVFQLCAQDPVCSQKLGGNPIQALEMAFASLNNQSCPHLMGLDAKQLRQILLLTLSINFESRVLGPAIVHRINQCTVQSAQELLQLRAIFTQIAQSKGQGENRMVFFNILLNEFWQPVKTAAELQLLDESLYFSSTQQAFYAGLFETWPLGHKKPLSSEIHSEVPVLMLHGVLDPATPLLWAEDAAQNFSRPHQQLVLFDQAGHVSLSSTPMENGESCAFNIFLDFIQNPRKPLDDSCRSNLMSLDFSGTSVLVQQMSMAIFGSSLWGE